MPPIIISDYSNVILASLLVMVALVGAALRRRRFWKPYPPGPKGLPLIGNVRDMPTSFEWLTYAEWSRQYDSDVIHLNLLGTHLVILNSAEAAYDLLDKRSALYSDRPRLPMLVELMGWDLILVYPYGNMWRAARRLFNQFFNLNAVGNLQPHMVKASDELLHRLAHEPAEFIEHIHLWAASLILNVTYGIDVQSSNNPFLAIIEAAVTKISIAGNPGAFLVDALPLLKYVPSWVPGASFKRKAKEWRGYLDEFSRAPFAYVKDKMETDTYNPSFTSLALERLESDDGPEAEKLVRSTAAATFAAGAETTISTLSCFFLAMMIHPDVQRKAQEELDRVVGQERLPGFSDLPSLPYTYAILQEIHRWKPVVPLGFPHRLTQDDVYKGHFIPAGSLVMGNVWAIFHDEKTYKDPERFNPERFLKDGQLDPDVKPSDVAFGFGRRACPGKHFANSSVQLNLARILATFEIGNAIGENGEVIIPSQEYTSGTVSHPLPFKCSIKPRSLRASELIEDAYATCHPAD